MPGLLVFSFVLSVLLSLDIPWRSMELEAMFAGIASGALLGGALCVTLVNIIKRVQNDGVVGVGWGAETVIGIYYGAFVVYGAWTYADLPVSLCSLWTIMKSTDCGMAFHIFRFSTDVILFAGLLFWGLWYEHKLGRQLIYRFSWVMQNPER